MGVNTHGVVQDVTVEQIISRLSTIAKVNHTGLHPSELSISQGYVDITYCGERMDLYLSYNNIDF